MLYAILLAYIMGIIVISLRDWYKGLCLLLPMLAFLERPDFPRALFGLEGLNSFNICLVFVLFSFLLEQRRGPKMTRLNPTLKTLLVCYLILFLLAFTRLLIAYEDFLEFYVGRGLAPSFVDLVKETLLNRVKWLVPALLIFRGANTIPRVRMSLLSLLTSAVLLALQVISRMAPTLLSGEDLGDRALRVIDRNIGYHRTDIGGILAGLAWASLACRSEFKSSMGSFLCIVAFLLCTLALFLTGSRACYLGWFLCGLVMVTLRWKKYILIGVPIVLVTILAVPGVQERMTIGFTEDTHSHYAQREGAVNTVDESGRDLYQITSGRIILWQLVVEAILQSPFIGYGMEGFKIAAINQKTIEFSGGAGLNVGHSHNAFLDLMVEGGLVTLSVVLVFYFLILNQARHQFGSKLSNPLQVAISGTLISIVVSQLVAYIGQGTLWPHQIATFMYCSIGLFLSSQSIREDSRASTKSQRDVPSKALWKQT